MQCAYTLRMLARFMPALSVYTLLAALAPGLALAQGELQSALAPAAEDASRLLELTQVLFIGGTLIFVVVMLLLALALYGPPRMRTVLGRHRLIIGGGIVFPTLTLLALLVYTLVTNPRSGDAGTREALRVEVIGELWWWRVRYLGQDGKVVMETANEIRIPVNRPVEIALASDNVIHSFWVPRLGGKIDLIPGHVTRQRVEANEPGIFRGQCAEYCGAQHARMALYIVALEANEYEAWLARQSRPAGEPQEPLQQLGRQVFMENRCALCHSIRGTPADGAFGPDLTHVGSRISIAGGVLPQNQGTIAGWISETQRIKPGARMPAYSRFTSAELRALSAYLAGLQ